MLALCAMPAPLNIASIICLASLKASCASLQLATGQQPLAASEQAPPIRMPLQSVEDWLFTTTFELGTPPQTFTAVLDISWSDLFVPSTACLQRPSSSCGSHPLFDANASASFQALGRRSKVNRAGFYTTGDVAEETVHLGSTSVSGQVFVQADDYRPTYVFDDSWYDSSLALSRQIVRGDDSDLQAKSPFQNLVDQKALRHNRFSLVLPQTPGEPGELVIGGEADPSVAAHPASTELPVQPFERSLDASVDYASYHPQGHIERTRFTTGGWDVQPISMTFGNVTYDVSSHTAAFSTAHYFLDLPYAFASPMRHQLGVSIWDGSIDCEVRSAGFPDLIFTFRGFNDELVNLSMTPGEYIREPPRGPVVDPSKCLVPIAMHHDQEEGGEEVPKFIILGNTFLRKFKSVFDADRESVTLVLR